MEIPRWALPVAALATSGMLLLTACGGESAPKQNAAAGSTQTPAQPQAKNAELEVTDNPKLGKIVVNGAGQTLYRFDKDTAKPPVSNCLDACAKAWPPVTTTNTAAVTGLNKELVGKVKRADGTWQVTLGGWPLYTFAKDTNPGDTKGQGVGGTWFVADPTGKKATKAPAPQAGNNRWKGKTVLRIVEDPELGKIVVNGAGRTLYRFDKDTPKPPVSNCLGACAKAWPPVKWTKNMKLIGINKSEIGNMMRKDGICQVTLNGWPLYLFAKDTKAGDTKGQGVGGTWFASNPDGKKALALDDGGGDTGGGGGDTGGGGYGNGY